MVSIKEFSVDLYIEMLMKHELLNELQVFDLCCKAKEILSKESNILQLQTPINVCGDIHGQFYDLLQLFKTGGHCPQVKYLFLGDYVDRGYYSCETILLLLALKVRYPEHMYLIRGNHESRQITFYYGFYEECLNKFGNPNVWTYCTEVFDHLSLSALIDNKVFCIHGGLSPILHNIDEIYEFQRKQEVPHDGALSDLLWSDPEDISGWCNSPRGAGFLFGADVTHNFLKQNQLEFICRAHQLVMEGYKEHFGGGVVTVWSAPNYCYRCGNVASILQLSESLKKEYLVFSANADESRRKNQTREKALEYFL